MNQWKGGRQSSLSHLEKDNNKTAGDPVARGHSLKPNSLVSHLDLPGFHLVSLG
jgi:hypothetical protein